MIDRIFNLTLTLAVLVAGTLAIGSEMLSTASGATQARVVSVLPRVVGTGSIAPAATIAKAGNSSDPVVQ